MSERFKKIKSDDINTRWSCDQKDWKCYPNIDMKKPLTTSSSSYENEIICKQYCNQLGKITDISVLSQLLPYMNNYEISNLVKSNSRFRQSFTPTTTIINQKVSKIQFQYQLAKIRHYEQELLKLTHKLNLDKKLPADDDWVDDFEGNFDLPTMVSDIDAYIKSIQNLIQEMKLANVYHRNKGNDPNQNQINEDIWINFYTSLYENIEQIVQKISLLWSWPRLSKNYHDSLGKLFDILDNISSLLMNDDHHIYLVIKVYLNILQKIFKYVRKDNETGFAKRIYKKIYSFIEHNNIWFTNLATFELLDQLSEIQLYQVAWIIGRLHDFIGILNFDDKTLKPLNGTNYYFISQDQLNRIYQNFFIILIERLLDNEIENVEEFWKIMRKFLYHLDVFKDNIYNWVNILNNFGLWDNDHKRIQIENIVVSSPGERELNFWITFFIEMLLANQIPVGGGVQIFLPLTLEKFDQMLENFNYDTLINDRRLNILDRKGSIHLLATRFYDRLNR